MKLKLPFLNRDPLVAVVRLTGAIGMPGRGSLTAAGIGPVLDRAFKRGKPAAVALQISSPGGSPVQSSLIGAQIRRLSDEKGIPVLAFVEDVAASGGYWLAAAADEIFADESSVVGSIGVISSGFGAHDLLTRHGVERRVHTAGESKSMLDPFQPEKEEDVARLKTLLEGIHHNFIAHVQTRRGARLKQDAGLFTGDVWLAGQAAELGLIDGVGHMLPVLRERYGQDVRMRRYGMRRPVWARLGARVVQDALTGIEERAAYARFGI